jgi:hypothetical protein
VKGPDIQIPAAGLMASRSVMLKRVLEARFKTA